MGEHPVIEAMARAIEPKYDDLNDLWQSDFRNDAKAALSEGERKP